MNAKYFLIFSFLVLILFSFSSFAYAQSENSNSVCVHFYWGQGCGACAIVKPGVEALNQKYSGFELQSFEVYNNRENMIQLLNFYEKYGIEQEERGIPTVIIDDAVYIGVPAIRENLENKFLEARSEGSACPSLVSGEGEVIASEDGEEEIASLESGQVSLLVLTLAALVDSINPCAIAVLVILMMALLASGGPKRALKAGIAFSISIFISYLLFGIGIFSLLKTVIGLFAEIKIYFYIIIGLLAVGVGIANIKDYFWYGKLGFVWEIPRSWRPTVKSILKKVTSPVGAFLVGFVISLFELPCTGGPYLFVLGLLAEKTAFFTALPLLIYYNLFFILPLIVVTILIYKGMETTEIDAWKERNIKRIHLITGIVMLALGIAVLAGVF